MSVDIIVVLCLGLLIYLLLVGQYISSIFLFTGALGIFLLGGMPQLNGFLQSDSFTQVASFSLTTIPLYILMAELIMGTKIVEDLYGLAFRVSKGRKGPLGVITVVIGGLLGAVSGSGSATSASMAKITLPELRKHGFSDNFAGAIVAVAGSLSAIIPPSVMIIIYGVAARISIGELFIGSLIPGILMILVYSVIVIGYLKFTKEGVTEQVTPPVDTTPVSKYIIAIIMGILMAISIFGGIFTGTFTPTEAGAVGAALAFVMALIMKAVNMNYLKTALLETTKISVMTIFIVIGASLFGRFISLSLIPRKILSLLEPLHDNPNLIIIILLIFYFILFMFIDNIAVLLMTIPIVLPITESLAVDPLWFGVMVLVSCTIGLITPPVGTNVFIVGSVTGISIEGIFRITFIFSIITSVVVVGLLILFPELITWLPSIMSK